MHMKRNQLLNECAVCMLYAYLVPSSGGNGFIVNATSKVPLSVGILLPSCAKARGTAAKIIMAAHNASLLTIPMPNDYTIEKLVDKSVPISLNYLDI